MKSEKIFMALGNVDDELINRYYEEIKKKKRQNIGIKYGAMVACFCIIVISFFANNIYSGKSKLNMGQTYKPNGVIVSDFPSNTSTSYVSPPQNGKHLFFAEVENALKENAGKNVTYFLAVDVFSNSKELAINSKELTEELQRLAKLGYHVGYAEAWTYQGKDEKVPFTYVAGYFTAKELQSFIASQDYGYTFRFVKNGDGSPVSPDQGIICNFGGRKN